MEYISIYIYICYVIYNYIIIYAYTIILRVINPLIVSYSDLYTYYMNSHSAMTWLVPVDPKDPTWHAHIPRLATSGWPNGPVLWSRMAVDNHQLIDCKQYKCALYIYNYIYNLFYLYIIIYHMIYIYNTYYIIYVVIYNIYILYYNINQYIYILYIHYIYILYIHYIYYIIYILYIIYIIYYILYMYTYMFLLKIDVISLPGQIAANQLCGNHVSTWWCVFCCSPRWYLVVMDVRSPGKKKKTPHIGGYPMFRSTSKYNIVSYAMLPIHIIIYISYPVIYP